MLDRNMKMMLSLSRENNICHRRSWEVSTNDVNRNKTHRYSASLYSGKVMCETQCESHPSCQNSDENHKNAEVGTGVAN